MVNIFGIKYYSLTYLLTHVAAWGTDSSIIELHEVQTESSIEQYEVA